MQIALAIGGVANRDLMYERPEAETTLLCFKEILHDNDLVVAQWPAGWQALQSYFGE